MTSDQDGLRGTSMFRSNLGAAMVCSLTLMAPAIIAGDVLSQETSTGTRIERLQSGESGLLSPRRSSATDDRSFEDLDTATSGLNDALDGARSKLDQLREAADIAVIAATLREELEASAEENNRLAKSLTEAEATQRSLETSLESGNDQIAELTRDLKEARSEAGDLDQQLRDSREQTSTTATALNAAEGRADRAEKQLTDSRNRNQTLSQENKVLKDKLRLARAERDDARQTTDVTREERDTANQELDMLRLRIAGLLRSVLHADEAVDAAALKKETSLVTPEAKPNVVAEVEPEDDADLARSYTVVQTSNIRSEPNRDATRVDIGIAGEEVSVLRKVEDDNWFEVKTKRGVTGYIFGELIQPES